MTAIPTRYDQLTQFPTAAKEAGECLLDCAKGALASVGVALTRGKSESFKEKAQGMKYIRYVGPILFDATLKIINPSAEYKTADAVYRTLITSPLAKKVADNKFLPDRVKMVASAPFLAITKIADLILGAIGAFFAFVTVGYFPSINTFAQSQFRALDVVTIPFALLYGLADPESKEAQYLLYQTT